MSTERAEMADLFGESLSEAERSYMDSRGESEFTPPEEDVSQPEPVPRETNVSQEQQAEPQQQDDDGDNEIFIDENGRVKDRTTGRFVPHAALHKERTRRQEVERQYTEEVRQRALVEGKIQALNQALGLDKQQTQQEAEQPIDPEEDIFGAFKQQKQVLEALQRQLEEQRNAQTQASEFTQLQNAYVSDAVRFNQQAPDFPDAYKFVKNQLHSELESQGFTDANQREAYIKQQELELVRNAFGTQQSPAQIIYNLAKSRGYQGAAPKAPTQSNAAAQKVQTIRAVQEQSASLAGRGQNSEAGLTYEQLADMSDDEMFEFAQRSPAAFKKLMRGF